MVMYDDQVSERRRCVRSRLRSSLAELRRMYTAEVAYRAEVTARSALPSRECIVCFRPDSMTPDTRIRSDLTGGGRVAVLTDERAPAVNALERAVMAYVSAILIRLEVRERVLAAIVLTRPA
ncbi:hypothetical protein [Jiangella rhizosphaerae]|uniref:Uncharacterized protein n=1 Tax=Jiangella rhizosphaerae TaxID=2293569 RepID=A0A418KJ68_9ACTN|nr:hypothetical protein [Jiangella rhizosphaerae]RIQ14407.1 hypothetical protein DY240_24910 [Jiangella rhizosphaerae]